jgi:hypothetical protein
LAVCGVVIPLLSSGTIYFVGMEWLDMVGELMNGVLQIYLGYKITNENVNVIVG